MGGIEVAVAEGKGGLKQFVELPYRLYRNERHWVPPLRIAVKELLDREKHPFYRNAEAEFFLALRDGEVVGRIAAVLDKAYNRFHDEEAGFFGFYESIDDKAVAKALLDRAWQWLQKRGATVMRGPVNPSTNYECGMLIDGFDSDPMVMMPYNPRYYPELMTEAGLRKAKDLYAYGSSVAGVGTEKSERVAEKAVAAAGITVRQIDLKNFNADVERVWQVYNSAWERNWGRCV